MKPTITPISEIEKKLQSGSLALAEEILGPKAFAAWGALLDSKAAGLTSAAGIQTGEKKDRVLFSGCVELFSHLVPVQCCLFDRDGERYTWIRLEYPAETYRQKRAPEAEDADESMLDLYLPQLANCSQQMIFSSFNTAEADGCAELYPADFAQVMPAAELKAGFNFPLAVTIDPAFASLIQQLFSGMWPTGQDTGLITLLPKTDSEVGALEPRFLVSRGLQANFELNPLGSPSFNIGFEHFSLGFSLAAEAEQGDNWPRMCLGGIASLGGATLAFEAEYDPSAQFLGLVFRGFPSLKTLLACFCDPAEWFPAPLDALLSIQLSSLEIGFDLAGKAVTEIKLSLTTDEEIELVENIVALKPTLELEIRSPFDADARALEGSLSGEWTLGSAKFDTSLSYPDYDLHAGLAQGQSLDVDALAQQVFGITLPEIAISTLELNGNFKEESFSFDLGIDSDWQIPLAGEHCLALKQLRMGMKLEEQERDFSLSGLAALDTVELALSAKYADAGWQFDGSTGPGQAIPIGTLIEELARLFGAQPDLPPALAGLVIKDLDLLFSTKTKDFTFTCGVDLPVSDTSSLAITLNIKVTHPEEVTRFTFDGEFALSLDDDLLEFEINFEHSRGLDKLIATCEHEGPMAIDISALLTALLPDDTDLSEMLADLAIQVDLKSIRLAFTHQAQKEAEPAKSLFGLQLSAAVSAVGADAVDIDSILFVSTQGAAAKEKEDKEKKESPTKILFGLKIGADLSLSKLPLVGSELPAGQDIGVKDLQLLAATQVIETGDEEALKDLLPENVIEIPKEKDKESTPPIEVAEAEGSKTEEKPVAGEDAEPALAKGVTVSAILQLGAESRPLILSPSNGKSQPGADDKVAKALPADAGAPEQTAPDKAMALVPAAAVPAESAEAPAVKWIKIQKAFGPVHFERIGFQYQDQVAWFLLDASLSAGGLSLSLDGLAFGSSITHFEPQFDLEGLGIAFKQGQVEIGGAFLKMSVPATDTVPAHIEYAGKALLRFKKLYLSAIGAYTLLDGQPSMYVYAVLDYQLGGPTFFYVAGLAAGFGYNRTLVIPPIEKVAEFPLIAEARSAQPASLEKTSLSAKLREMQAFVPVKPGDYFLTAGVHFTSFKMIDTFALLVVSFGSSLEINLLGISTMQIPTPEAGKTCLAKIEVAFKASFIPDEGFVGLVAQLTSASFIFSKDCHLTGGLAFFSWFAGEHAGDFVLTVGGYHRLFNPPAHYPSVPRLSLNWQVNGNLSIKGEGYFALTPVALMAGGMLEANWTSGNLRAWFTAAADFLVIWKPFHYDAIFSISIGVSYTFNFFGTHHISASLGADLHIWGPDFSGVAHIHLWFISFSVSFGAQDNHKPSALTWSEFEASFLPVEVLTAAITSGLANKGGATDDPRANLGVINPNTFCLAVDSAVPIRTGPNVMEQGAPPEANFGNVPMGLTGEKAAQFNPQLSITIAKVETIRVGEDSQLKSEPCAQAFSLEPVRRSVPAGLWGTQPETKLDTAPLVKDVLSGVDLKPKPSQPPGPRDIAELDLTHLSPASSEARPLDLAWNQDYRVGVDQTPTTSERRATMKASLVQSAARRGAILQALRPGSPPVSPSESVVDDFLIVPQMEA